MQLLKQSTASTVYVGPVLDSAGAAVTTAVVGDFRLVKNGTAATLSGATVTHDANGYYTVALTTTNTDTTGRLTLAVGNTAMSMSTHRYSVLLASVYDAFITNATNATGGLPTATGSISALAGAISTYAGGDTSGVTTLLTRLPSAISLNAGAVTVGTNNDKTGYSLVAGTGLGNQTANITGSLSGSVGSVTSGVTVATNNDKTGYALTQAFPSNFSSLAITVGGAVTAGTVSDKTGYSLSSGGLAAVTSWSVAITGNITGNLSGSVGSVTSGVTVSTNNDKTGYSLTQSFPSNFASMSLDVSGRVLLQPTQTGVTIPTVTSVTNGVTASTVSDKTGYSLTQAFPTNFSSLAIAAGTGAVTVKGDAFGNTLVLTNLANASQIPAEFTSATFASTGVFSTAALANAPAGGGGGGTDWTANERTAIRSILGFDSNGTVSLPTVGVMDAIKDKTDLITSDGISVLEDRVNESTITMQYNESTTASVNLDEDTTSATLQFVVSRPDGTDILTIANGSITRTASSFTVAITTAVTATLGQYLWSLRDITGGTNRVVTKGVLTVQNAASA